MAKSESIVNPFHRTFLRAIGRPEWERTKQKPYTGLLASTPAEIPEEDYLTKLALDLRVHEDVAPGRTVRLESLISKKKRTILFDVIGAGKRTTARRLFHARMFGLEKDVEPEFLPCWLPDPDVLPDTRDDLLGLIARVTRASAGETFNRDMLSYWLKHDVPLLLFLELNHFKDPSQIFQRLAEFIRTFPKTCCVVTCHSNPGWRPNRDDAEGFVYYSIERPTFRPA